jgi:hypothetical protein
MTQMPATKSAAPTAAAVTAGVSPRVRRGVSVRYWVCLLVLVAAAVGLKALAWRVGWVLRKEAVPLRRALRDFDLAKLGPRYERNKLLTDKIPPMSEDLVESLGTEDYLQLYLTDTERSPADRTQIVQVFITYYTGKPDMVPHVPDECYAASGLDLLSRVTEQVPATGCGAPADRVPVAVLEFQAGRKNELITGGEDRVTVMYFFHASGGYTTTRDGVRERLSNPFQRHAYYAKIEISFLNAQSVHADRAASLAAAGPLIERLMPVLLTDHFDMSKFAPAAGTRGAPVGD